MNAVFDVMTQVILFLTGGMVIMVLALALLAIAFEIADVANREDDEE